MPFPFSLTRARPHAERLERFVVGDTCPVLSPVPRAAASAALQNDKRRAAGNQVAVEQPATVVSRWRVPLARTRFPCTGARIPTGTLRRLAGLRASPNDRRFGPLPGRKRGAIGWAVSLFLVFCRHACLLGNAESGMANAEFGGVTVRNCLSLSGLAPPGSGLRTQHSSVPRTLLIRT